MVILKQIKMIRYWWLLGLALVLIGAGLGFYQYQIGASLAVSGGFGLLMWLALKCPFFMDGAIKKRK